MPIIDYTFLLCLCFMLAACAIGTLGMASVCISALKSSERQAEATAARLQARTLGEHHDVLGPQPEPPERKLPYEEGPDAEVFEQTGAFPGDPDAPEKMKRWNELFRSVDQQFTHPMGPGATRGSPVFAPPPARIGDE